MTTNNEELQDVVEDTFKDKILSYLEKLNSDLESTKKEVEFHELIISTFEDHGVEHPYTAMLKESIAESKKFIEVLEAKGKQGKKLLEFLNGDFVLEFNKFAFLMIDVVGSQMVNFVELLNEYEEVVKLWKTTENQ